MNYCNGKACTVGTAWLAVLLAALSATAQLEAVAPAFEQLREYDGGKPRAPLYTIERFVGQSTKDVRTRKDVADRFSAMLVDPGVSRAAKVFIFSQLPLVAGEDRVPLLVKLLDDPETADLARGALEDIPGDASARALRDALARMEGDALTGVINSLGIRRDAMAVPALSKLLGNASQHAAAARSLGQIGTGDAAAALATVAATTAVYDARLRCAVRLLEEGRQEAAATICRDICKGDRPLHVRVAALTGLVNASGPGALPLIEEAMAADDAMLQTAATRLCGGLPGEKATAALAMRLDHVGPDAQVGLIAALADRGDRAAAAAIRQRIDADSEAVKLAAVRAVGAIGDADCVALLAGLAAESAGNIPPAARSSLAQLSGPGVEEAIVAGATRGDAAERIELLRALGARNRGDASRLLLDAATDQDAAVRGAALASLKQAGRGQCFPDLLGLLCSPTELRDCPAILEAAAAVGARMTGPPKCVPAIIEAMKGASPTARASLLKLLARFGGADALQATRLALRDPDAATVDAAVRALADWPDASAAGDLLAIAANFGDRTHRALALRGYFGLAEAAANAREKFRMLEEGRKIATTPEAKRLLLAALSGSPGKGTLDMARSYQNDSEVAGEADLAVKQISAAMSKKEGNRARMSPALKRDAERSRKLKAGLAARMKGQTVVCYLDCGPDREDGSKGGPSVRLVSGAPFAWGGSERAADPRYGTIFFTGTEVAFEAAGLDSKKFYKVGFSWWDFDHNDRVLSVWATGGGKRVKILRGTKLPSYAVGRNKPVEKILAIPRALCAGGKVTITFKLESGTNAAVSEMWLLESDREGSDLLSAAPAKTAIVAAGDIPSPGNRDMTNVLIITGVDYPGHKWQETCPVLKDLLEADKQLQVQVSEDPHRLASEKIHEYDAIVLHFMDWKVPSPGTEARENLKKYLRAGGGIVLVHFACGAWQDWPEFEKLAGRVWNPKLRGHDPYRTFTVEIKDPDHPITEGMESFATTDELYTCLDGTTDMHVIAESRSKVDKKMYPMGFVLNYGKGRVFHCPLGHDVKAFEAPAVGELFRRGTAWVAGRD